MLNFPPTSCSYVPQLFFSFAKTPESEFVAKLKKDTESLQCEKVQLEDEIQSQTASIIELSIELERSKTEATKQNSLQKEANSQIDSLHAEIEESKSQLEKQIDLFEKFKRKRVKQTDQIISEQEHHDIMSEVCVYDLALFNILRLLWLRWERHRLADRVERERGRRRALKTVRDERDRDRRKAERQRARNEREEWTGSQ